MRPAVLFVLVLLPLAALAHEEKEPLFNLVSLARRSTGR